MAAKKSIPKDKAMQLNNHFFTTKTKTMEQNISTMQDVKTFLEQLATEIDNFDPLRNFSYYVIGNTQTKRYTEEEAAHRDKCLLQCLKVAEFQVEDCFEYVVWYFELKHTQLVNEQG